MDTLIKAWMALAGTAKQKEQDVRIFRKAKSFSRIGLPQMRLLVLGQTIQRWN